MAMIVEYLDSFDYPAALGADSRAALEARGWTNAGSNNNGFQLIDAGQGALTGAGSLSMSPNSAQHRITRPLSGNYQSLSVRLRVAVDRSTANGEDLITLLDGASPQLIVDIDGTTGTLIVRIGGAGTALITATNALPSDNEHDIELLCKIANSGGFAELYVDGVQVGSTFTGDTQNTANAYANTLAIGQFANSIFGWVIDDLRVYRDDAAGDATVMGPSRVYVKRVTADGVEQDFTPSTGSDGYAMLDEGTSDGDTTYVTSATDAHRSTYDGGAVNGAVSAVLGAQVVAVARKTDANSRDVLVGVLDVDGGTEDQSSAQALTSVYAAYYHPFNDTPGGSGIAASDITDMALSIEANQ